MCYKKFCFNLNWIIRILVWDIYCIWGALPVQVKCKSACTNKSITMPPWKYSNYQNWSISCGVGAEQTYSTKKKKKYKSQTLSRYYNGKLNKCTKTKTYLFVLNYNLIVIAKFLCFVSLFILCNSLFFLYSGQTFEFCQTNKPCP